MYPKPKNIGLGVGDASGAPEGQRYSQKAGVDPKVVSDQRGHGLGVSLEVYTRSDTEQK